MGEIILPDLLEGQALRFFGTRAPVKGDGINNGPDEFPPNFWRVDQVLASIRAEVQERIWSHEQLDAFLFHDCSMVSEFGGDDVSQCIKSRYATLLDSRSNFIPRLVGRTVIGYPPLNLGREGIFVARLFGEIVVEDNGPVLMWRLAKETVSFPAKEGSLSFSGLPLGEKPFDVRYLVRCMQETGDGRQILIEVARPFGQALPDKGMLSLPHEAFVQVDFGQVLLPPFASIRSTQP